MAMSATTTTTVTNNIKQRLHEPRAAPAAEHRPALGPRRVDQARPERDDADRRGPGVFLQAAGRGAVPAGRVYRDAARPPRHESLGVHASRFDRELVDDRGQRLAPFLLPSGGDRRQLHLELDGEEARPDGVVVRGGQEVGR